MGYDVYVDWIEDRQLDRNNVNEETVAQLRVRLKNCRSLLFATSENSSSSKWMPWELGYFDAYREKVAILPINDSFFEKHIFEGQEYLGLYSYAIEHSGQLAIQDKSGFRRSYRQWLHE